MAAIAAVHSGAPTWDDTDWHEVVGLYDVLVQIWPSPVVALNRAVAVGFEQGPEAGSCGLGAADGGATTRRLWLPGRRSRGLPAATRTQRRGSARIRGGVAVDRESSRAGLPRRTTLGDHRTQPGVIRPSAWADPYARGMPPRFVDPTDPSAPLVWRVPSWQPTVMMLFVCGVVAFNLYASPNTLVRVVTIGVGAVAFMSAIEGLRMYLVVDQNGIGFRGLFRTHNIDWSDISCDHGSAQRVQRADASNHPSRRVLCRCSAVADASDQAHRHGQGARATRRHRSHDHRLWAGPTSLARAQYGGCRRCRRRSMSRGGSG